MSAFVVESTTLQTIVSGLVRSVGNESYGQRATAVADLLDGTGISPAGLTAPDGPDKLARSLHLLNVSAVCQRYPDDTPDEYPMPDVAVGPTPDPVQLYKSIRCYLYQCSEGRAPRRKLYRDMERVATNLAHNIVQALPAYDRAEWG